MCVGSCPTLLVEGEVHQHINSSAKYISIPWLTFLHEARTKAYAGLVRVPVLLNVRVEDESVSRVGASACFTQRTYLRLRRFSFVSKRLLNYLVPGGFLGAFNFVGSASATIYLNLNFLCLCCL